MKRIIVLVGPTCSGKTTLEQHLNQRGIPSIVSYTTRTPRTGEVHGQHYYFLTDDEVANLAERDRVVQKVRFAGYSYGSTVDAIDAAFSKSDTAVIVVEPTGRTQFEAWADKQGDVEIVSVYITNSLKTLVTRCLARFVADRNADLGYYAQRIADIADQHRLWPHYFDDWSHIIEEMDDAGPATSVSSVADRILGSKTR